MHGKQTLNWIHDDDEDNDDDKIGRSEVKSFAEFLRGLTKPGCRVSIVSLSSWYCSHAVELCYIMELPSTDSVLKCTY